MPMVTLKNLGGLSKVLVEKIKCHYDVGGGGGSWSMIFYNCISFRCDYAFLWLNKSRHASMEQCQINF